MNTTKKIFAAVLGAILIAVGVLGALNVLGLTTVELSLDGWWALFLIVPGISGLFSAHKDKLGSLFILLLGVFLLLAARGVVEYAAGLQLVVPLILVLLGIKFIARIFSAPQASPSFKTTDSAEVSAVFNEQHADLTGKNVSAAKVCALFGGAECNLSGALLQDKAQIDVMCAFGGVELRVPENVIIRNQTFCLFGGMSDKRSRPANEGDITIDLQGVCVFGGIDIK